MTYEQEQSAKDLELAELRAQNADLIGQLQTQHIELLTMTARAVEYQTKYEVASMGPSLAQTAMIRKRGLAELEATKLRIATDLGVESDTLTSAKLRDQG